MPVLVPQTAFYFDSRHWVFEAAIRDERKNMIALETLTDTTILAA